jgi:hypothetical protein
MVIIENTKREISQNQPTRNMKKELKYQTTAVKNGKRWKHRSLVIPRMWYAMCLTTCIASAVALWNAWDTTRVGRESEVTAVESQSVETEFQTSKKTKRLSEAAQLAASLQQRSSMASKSTAVGLKSVSTADEDARMNQVFETMARR